MKKILVIGSMNMDFVTDVPHMPAVGETILAQGLEFVPGGKGANQAFAMGRLGGSVAMLGAVGADTYGERLCENLARAGVDVSQVRRCQEAATSIAVIGVTPQGDNSIIVLPGANRTVDRAYLEEHRGLLEDCDILAMQLEIPLDTVLYAAKEAKALGKTVVLDPAPAVPDLPEELFPCLDLIKPNETELSILTGRPYRPEDLGERPGPAGQRGEKRAGHPGGRGLVPAERGRQRGPFPRGQDRAGGGHHRRRGQLYGRAVRGPGPGPQPGGGRRAGRRCLRHRSDPPGRPELHPHPGGGRPRPAGKRDRNTWEKE